ncbi:helix-turn-helix transcriptional regulator [Shimwellia blattae]|uniref:Putative regulatory protein Cro of prophage n=1 Tax=Shimwellia blattae (strain ATCC 29907 / DSM 4481 / JCM 1650 / NBRC 105725 / CDC 9005-74) TaxID=630626 RepID=I2B9T9_SHIBC|nr:hypothetical protein [Shimwellia blattae]AFJ47293.1 putative regulatory protein Cro of prophage [Shimwellia blattae DSM 4481 = NBRC 105725]GAB80514.1 hypothetical protein EB105725_05_02420 [Shimwellia blattae DSM 4481 = NBRC 105725]VDY64784.1 Uncharacterised protein [Shimwellia blattae]VEC22883.1 Uncharacterised protein [Shimwellia blattae]
MGPSNLGEIIKYIRVPVVAEVCGRSPRAIYKWMRSGCLPRTEWTGETDYARRISVASDGKYSPEQILEVSKPKQVV